MKIIIALLLGSFGFADNASMHTIAELNRNQGLHDCYGKYLQKDEAHGLVKIDMELNKTGGVLQMHFDSKQSTLDQPEFVQCVTRVLQKLTFPSESAGKMKVLSVQLQFPMNSMESRRH